MKAAALYGPNTPLQVVDVEQQGPKAGEARVRAKAAGICRSDWHIVNGDWTLPLPIDQLVRRAYTLDEIKEGFTALRGGQVARGAGSGFAVCSSDHGAKARTSRTSSPYANCKLPGLTLGSGFAV